MEGTDMPWRDILERSIWTLVQSAGAAGTAIVVAPGITCTGDGAGTAALIGGFAAAYSLVKGLVASRIGQPTAALPG